MQFHEGAESQCGGATGIGAGGGGAGAGGDGRGIQGHPTGLVFGDKAFRQELGEPKTERIGTEHYGAERLETAVENAGRSLGAELKARRWKEADLSKRAKGDLGKVQIAARLREESLVTVKWIAERLGMGSAGYLNNRLYRWRQGSLR